MSKYEMFEQEAWERLEWCQMLGYIALALGTGSITLTILALTGDPFRPYLPYFGAMLIGSVVVLYRCSYVIRRISRENSLNFDE